MGELVRRTYAFTHSLIFMGGFHRLFGRYGDHVTMINLVSTATCSVSHYGTIAERPRHVSLLIVLGSSNGEETQGILFGFGKTPIFPFLIHLISNMKG